MSGNTKVVLFLVVLGMLIVGAWAINEASPKIINPSEESIGMVQVCGWLWCKDYDAHYAQQVNLPNSQANKNNAEANYSNAQAEALEKRAYKDNAEAVTLLGFTMSAGFCGFGIFGIGLIALILKLKAG